MAQFNMFGFQEKAVNDIIGNFKNLWNANYRGAELTFKSPTGSGKTFMVSNFVHELNNQPDWSEDVAFVWITFSDDLAMQSKSKFDEYFYPNTANTLLTISDIVREGILKTNDVLFINWQKLVSRRAADRVNRRPDDEMMYKEQGFYFEDVVERTHAEGREFVLIIDESHKNVTEAAFRDVIKPIDPRIIINVSATPEKEPSFSDVSNHRAAWVEVNRQDVVDAGLIKSEILSQTEEDLNAYSNPDHDLLLLDLAIEKRNALLQEWQMMGKNVNPLVLVQLPDDEKKLVDAGSKSKEEVVVDYLTHQGIDRKLIACWFDNKRENMEGIADNDNPVQFMLFKYAAGTGWDCPRAQVLVMYREIKSDTFRTQTLGRILRMPLPNISLKEHPMLEKGYLFTNYSRNEVEHPIGKCENAPKTIIAQVNTQQIVGQAIQTYANSIVPDLFSAATEQQAPKQIQQTAEQIVKHISQVAGEIVQIKQTEADVHKRRERIEAKKQEAVQQVKEAAQALLTASNLTEQQKEQVQAAIQKVSNATSQTLDTAAGKRVIDIIPDPLLQTEFHSRVDYGDLGKASDFQPFFVRSMNKYFGMSENDVTTPAEQLRKLQAKGIDTNPTYLRDIFVNARFVNFEDETVNDWGKNVKRRVSDNDIEKEFTWKCAEVLVGQSDDNTKIGNLSRSWGIMKGALRKWFDMALANVTHIQCYVMFIRDVNRGPSSVFIAAINKILQDYHPVLEGKLAEKQRENEARAAAFFSIHTEPTYPANYVLFTPAEKSLTQPFYLPPMYKGVKNETEFIRFLEQKENSEKIEWWWKNGTDKESLGFRYTDELNHERRIFYPDWLIRFKDGRMGVFDTKGGNTADSIETRNKAEELTRRMEILNEAHRQKGDNISYVWGIVVFEDGLWWYNDGKKYIAYKQKKDAWKHFSELFL